MNTNLEKCQEAVIQHVKNQLGEDSRQTDDTKLSLCAKWAPSINTSSKETRRLAHILARGMGVTPAKYRKTLSNLLTLAMHLAIENAYWGMFDPIAAVCWLLQ